MFHALYSSGGLRLWYELFSLLVSRQVFKEGTEDEKSGEREGGKREDGEREGSEREGRLAHSENLLG